MTQTTKRMFEVAKDGHIFAVKHLENGRALLTNEYGKQTNVDFAFAARILGFIAEADSRKNAENYAREQTLESGEGS